MNNIVFYKSKTYKVILIKIGMYISNINLKIHAKFHAIWMEIDGNMDLLPIKTKLIISILYGFPVFYICSNKSKNIYIS